MEEGDAQLNKEERDLLTKLHERLIHTTNALEKLHVAEYIEFLRSPFRLIWVNLLAGLARGVGFALGATLLSSFLLYLLFRLAELNLPVIGEFIARIVMIVTNHL